MAIDTTTRQGIALRYVAALTRFTSLVQTHEKRIASRLSTAETQTLINLLEKVRAGTRSI